MTTFFAVCNVGGPISVTIDADSTAEAVSIFEAMDTRSLIDNCSTDAEDDLDIADAEGMSEDEFSSEMEAAGFESVWDLSEIVNGHTMRASHVADAWMLWEKQ